MQSYIIIYDAVKMAHIQLRTQFRALHDDENLRHFVIEARSTGRKLGVGAYGTVEEVQLTFNIFILLYGSNLTFEMPSG